jgi:hypothetical protein
MGILWYQGFRKRTGVDIDYSDLRLPPPTDEQLAAELRATVGKLNGLLEAANDRGIYIRLNAVTAMGNHATTIECPTETTRVKFSITHLSKNTKL